MTDEDVVADSEDEVSPYSVALGDLTSTEAVARNSRSTGDNISCFTEDPATKSMETSIASFDKNSTTTSRPKPRPAYKGTAAIANAITSIGNSPLAGTVTNATAQEQHHDVRMGNPDPLSRTSLDTGFSLDIAERAKMRSRNASKLTPPIQLTSSPPVIARQRPKPKPKRASNSKARVSPAPEVIILTSDEEDELSLPPLKHQDKSHAKSETLSKSAPEIAKQLNSSFLGLPAVTSEDRHTRVLPSDTIAQDKEQDHPPIAFLPNDSDADIFLSSSPLFSPFPAERRKRKRQGASSLDRNMDIENNMDLDMQTIQPPPFLASSSSDMQNSHPPPPPPLFAPPSSSVNDSGIEMEVPVPVALNSGAKKNTGRKKTTTKQDEPKKGKTQNIDDDDFDLGTEWPKKKRPSAKTKKGGKKNAGGQGVDSQMSKVVKSNEFIDDNQDREHGPVALPVADLSATLTMPAIGTTSPQSALSSALDYDAGGVPEEKRKKVTTDINSKRRPRKGKPVVLSDDDEDDAVIGDEGNELVVLKSGQATKTQGKRKEKEGKIVRNANIEVGKFPNESDGLERTGNVIKENRLIPNPPSTASKQPIPPSSRTYSIASRTKSTPMSELIHRVNSLPGSPFAATPHRSPLTTKTGTAYSPYLKSSRSALSRIAPLHPNRRTPPPPLPKPPPPKKTKKQLEKEEKWEEELQESIEGWATLTDEERAAIRRAKRAMDEGWED